MGKLSAIFGLAVVGLCIGCGAGQVSLDTDMVFERTSDVSVPAEDTNAALSSDAALELPYRERTNPFTYAGGTDNNRGGSLATPRLLGYVDVRGPSAVFSNQGKIDLMKVGDHLADFTIVKIEPLYVEIERRGVRERISFGQSSRTPSAVVDESRPALD